MAQQVDTARMGDAGLGEVAAEVEETHQRVVMRLVQRFERQLEPDACDGIGPAPVGLGRLRQRRQRLQPLAALAFACSVQPLREFLLGVQRQALKQVGRMRIVDRLDRHAMRQHQLGLATDPVHAGLLLQAQQPLPQVGARARRLDVGPQQGGQQRSGLRAFQRQAGCDHGRQPVEHAHPGAHAQLRDTGQLQDDRFGHARSSHWTATGIGMAMTCARRAAGCSQRRPRRGVRRRTPSATASASPALDSVPGSGTGCPSSNSTRKRPTTAVPSPPPIGKGWSSIG